MSQEPRLRACLPPDARAMIVDDSAATRRICRGHLESLGVQVEEASDGSEALARLEAEIQKVNVIFSDINMPGMDGFELCHRLLEAPWYDGTPLVMVSTQSDASFVIRALKLGADDYIPKPFDREMLALVLERVLQHD